MGDTPSPALWKIFLPDLGGTSIPDSAAVSIFVDMLVELTNTVVSVFVNSTNITTNIETAALSS